MGYSPLRDGRSAAACHGSDAVEAEAGYDLVERASEANPHRRGVPTVPMELVDAIEERARRDGQSPEAAASTGHGGPSGGQANQQGSVDLLPRIAVVGDAT